jgi:ATP/maltotriose-dependent transcriptional regulator MalT
MLAPQARLDMPGEARAALAALDDERAGSGEIRNACAAICLAGGDPAAALDAVRDVRDGTARALSYFTLIEAELLAADELSTGELRVLRYLPTNLSRPEIASELRISLNTVSTQIRSTYAKLQVRDRSAAVRRARELRLLSAGRTR